VEFSIKKFDMKLSYFHTDHAFSFKSRTTALLKIYIRVWNLLNILFLSFVYGNE